MDEQRVSCLDWNPSPVARINPLMISKMGDKFHFGPAI